MIGKRFWFCLLTAVTPNDDIAVLSVRQKHAGKRVA